MVVAPLAGAMLDHITSVICQQPGRLTGQSVPNCSCPITLQVSFANQVDKIERLSVCLLIPQFANCSLNAGNFSIFFVQEFETPLQVELRELCSALTWVECSSQ